MKNFQYNDGGRAKAGFKGSTGDCVTRSIAILIQKPYLEVYNDLNKLCKAENNIRIKKGKRKCSSRTGIARKIYEKYLESLGYKWIPTMLVGKGCKVHLCKEELPSGRIACRVSKHLTTVIDGVINDTFNPSRDGKCCVYGYYIKK